ncbi:MAG: hypothetical protein BWY83_03233 [bacterium ADurb.Bin478]|nr:MAG: hypothetical protein BWY83_03233 [bacterium ADurb.Bin478]
MRQRRIDLTGFQRDASPFFLRQELQGAHVVQTVGEFDQDHPDIADHGEQHFAKVLRLPLFKLHQFDLRDLGDPIHQLGDIVAELLLHLFNGYIRILRDIMEHTAGDGLIVHAQADENFCHLQRMLEIGPAGFTQLVSMGVVAELERLAQQFDVHVLIIPRDAVHQPFEKLFGFLIHSRVPFEFGESQPQALQRSCCRALAGI